jgi:ankyrin repeat domain-containing protein 50
LKSVTNYRNSTLALALSKGIDDVKEQSTNIQKDLAALREEAERDKIISWLSVTDPSLNHYAACKKHQPATGEWLFQHAKFEHWIRTQNSHLWLYGNGENPLSF